ncbi:armadillo-type protein [Dimargaris cristalligena]|uniref:Armadillo-type protein n=1 Tax=Dimargaris cristalligena TaxID=215637 RepID=A0A4P9ZQG4_9FUNG|nr:armadillo-type protein [Dimargaris cristalligena]|eukprot:RKP34971.1 armadillo-type protein [Dimargaris cristalligena]
MYSLCKDQHGCRFLQKQLEESPEKNVPVIFKEVFPHFVELMTDPFGNYLCQKLVEYCNDEQRTQIVDIVASELINISLNMHGTRAVQKMIEFLSNKAQIRAAIIALKASVVPLIKDLNGNHVIQKCLNRLTSEENQFIYDAVATHRHGCCVFQRCIDHASEPQKHQLVREVTANALMLVQDPFGNYVVQYVLDLNRPDFADPLIRQFTRDVCALSMQKFSSNVIEKCIRAAEASTRRLLVADLLTNPHLEDLLKDSFANYVIQTALDFSDQEQRTQLIEAIRPILPAIRNTPYGKRIQSKIQRDPQAAALLSESNSAVHSRANSPILSPHR